MKRVYLKLSSFCWDTLFGSLLILISMVPVNLCFSLGAPSTACQDLVPRHGFQPQVTEPPAEVVVDRGSLPADQYLRITLRSYQPMKGFLLVADSVASNGVEGGLKAIGTWYIPYLNNTSVQSEARYLDCESGLQNAVTHSGRSISSYIVSFQWKPAENFSGDVVVRATVVLDYRTYWSNIKSTVVTVYPVQAVHANAMKAATLRSSVQDAHVVALVQRNRVGVTVPSVKAIVEDDNAEVERTNGGALDDNADGASDALQIEGAKDNTVLEKSKRLYKLNEDLRNTGQMFTVEIAAPPIHILPFTLSDESANQEDGTSVTMKSAVDDDKKGTFLSSVNVQSGPVQVRNENEDLSVTQQQKDSNSESVLLTPKTITESADNLNEGTKNSNGEKGVLSIFQNPNIDNGNNLKIGQSDIEVKGSVSSVFDIFENSNKNREMESSEKESTTKYKSVLMTAVVQGFNLQKGTKRPITNQEIATKANLVSLEDQNQIVRSSSQSTSTKRSTTIDSTEKSTESQIDLTFVLRKPTKSSKPSTLKTINKNEQTKIIPMTVKTTATTTKKTTVTTTKKTTSTTTSKATAIRPKITTTTRRPINRRPVDIRDPVFLFHTTKAPRINFLFFNARKSTTMKNGLAETSTGRSAKSQRNATTSKVEQDQNTDRNKNNEIKQTIKINDSQSTTRSVVSNTKSIIGKVTSLSIPVTTQSTLEEKRQSLKDDIVTKKLPVSSSEPSFLLNEYNNSLKTNRVMLENESNSKFTEAVVEEQNNSKASIGTSTTSLIDAMKNLGDKSSSTNSNTSSPPMFSDVEEDLLEMRNSTVKKYSPEISTSMADSDKVIFVGHSTSIEKTENEGQTNAEMLEPLLEVNHEAKVSIFLNKNTIKRTSLSETQEDLSATEANTVSGKDVTTDNVPMTKQITLASVPNEDNLRNAANNDHQVTARKNSNTDSIEHNDVIVKEAAEPNFELDIGTEHLSTSFHTRENFVTDPLPALMNSTKHQFETHDNTNIEVNFETNIPALPIVETIPLGDGAVQSIDEIDKNSIGSESSPSRIPALPDFGSFEKNKSSQVSITNINHINDDSKVNFESDPIRIPALPNIDIFEDTIDLNTNNPVMSIDSSVHSLLQDEFDSNLNEKTSRETPKKENNGGNNLTIMQSDVNDGNIDELEEDFSVNFRTNNQSNLISSADKDSSTARIMKSYTGSDINIEKSGNVIEINYAKNFTLSESDSKTNEYNSTVPRLKSTDFVNFNVEHQYASTTNGDDFEEAISEMSIPEPEPEPEAEDDKNSTTAQGREPRDNFRELEPYQKMESDLGSWNSSPNFQSFVLIFTTVPLLIRVILNDVQYIILQ